MVEVVEEGFWERERGPYRRSDSLTVQKIGGKRVREWGICGEGERRWLAVEDEGSRGSQRSGEEGGWLMWSDGCPRGIGNLVGWDLGGT